MICPRPSSSSRAHLPPKSISTRPPPLKATQTAFGGADAENPVQRALQTEISSGVTNFFIRHTRSKPCPRGASGGAGWARDSPCGPLSATISLLYRLHLSCLSRRVMTLQTAAALQRRSEALRRSMRQREMDAISPLRAPSLLFSYPLPAIKCSAPRQYALILQPPVDNASSPHHNRRHAPSRWLQRATTTTAPTSIAADAAGASSAARR
jgi:hypothetical protein